MSATVSRSSEQDKNVRSGAGLLDAPAEGVYARVHDEPDGLAATS